MPAKKTVKPGRPELPKGEALEKVIQSRVQPSEFKSFEKAAKAEGLKLSEWVRKTLKEAVQK